MISLLIVAITAQIGPDLAISIDNLPMKTTIGRRLALDVTLKNISRKTLVFPSELPQGQCYGISTKPVLPSPKIMGSPPYWPVQTTEVHSGGHVHYSIGWDQLFDMRRAKRGNYKVTLTISTFGNEKWIGKEPTAFEKSLELSLKIGNNGQVILRGPL